MRRRGKLPRTLGYDPYTILARGTQSRSPSGMDRCQPIRTGEDMDSSSQLEEAKSDEQHTEHLVEHHGQLHDLDHGEWEATTLLESHRANDGTFKTVDEKKPREEYL